jgi:hypothetical protein
MKVDDEAEEEAEAMIRAIESGEDLSTQVRSTAAASEQPPRTRRKASARLSKISVPETAKPNLS